MVSFANLGLPFRHKPANESSQFYLYSAGKFSQGTLTWSRSRLYCIIYRDPVFPQEKGLGYSSKEKLPFNRKKPRAEPALAWSRRVRWVCGVDTASLQIDLLAANCKQ